MSSSPQSKVCTLLDYGAGNVRSVRNAITKLGFEVVDAREASDIANAEKLVFPGVGAFGQAVANLKSMGLWEALQDYLRSGRPFFGICLGFQMLFEGSEESEGVAGLGFFKGTFRRFRPSTPGDRLSVPHMGWNGLRLTKHASIVNDYDTGRGDKVYFVHSFRVLPNAANRADVLAVTDYGGTPAFVSAVSRGNVVGTQFHPEKSGRTGLAMLQNFLCGTEPRRTRPLAGLVPTTPADVVQASGGVLSGGSLAAAAAAAAAVQRTLQHCGFGPTVLAKRIVACLDVRSNDVGDLVVTKGFQYDVREAAAPAPPPPPAAQNASTDASSNNNKTKQGATATATTKPKGRVRNFGGPVAAAENYYNNGADEIAFLNITAFRKPVLADQPMLQVLEASSKNIFVPLCVGGGIQDYEDAEGNCYTALDVATCLFRAGADKISIGSAAVRAVQSYIEGGRQKTGKSCIEQIARVYGRQAVVISVDPRRVYVNSPDDTPHACVQVGAEGNGAGGPRPGPNGEQYCWYRCTTKGARGQSELDVPTLVAACAELGAGEILLNLIDNDGVGEGFDSGLVALARSVTDIPVVASSGAGKPEHFAEVFELTGVEAALGAGIFHRKEVSIAEVKEATMKAGFDTVAVSNSN